MLKSFFNAKRTDMPALLQRLPATTNTNIRKYKLGETLLKSGKE